MCAERLSSLRSVNAAGLRTILAIKIMADFIRLSADSGPR